MKLLIILIAILFPLGLCIRLSNDIITDKISLGINDFILGPIILAVFVVFGISAFFLSNKKVIRFLSKTLLVLAFVFMSIGLIGIVLEAVTKQYIIAWTAAIAWVLFSLSYYCILKFYIKTKL